MTDEHVNQVEPLSVTSTSLLRCVQANDPAAWQRIVSLYSPLIFHWCQRAGLQAADAADVSQEVFRAVAHAIGAFRRDRPGDSFRGWLRVITRNKLRDWARQRQLEVPAVGGAELLDLLGHQDDNAKPTADPADVAEDSQLLLRRALELIQAEFEERRWQAFWRVTIEDQSPDQVALDLGMTANAVYLAKSRILRRLREEFVELLDI
ncbi:MAG: RNA polymerase sigma factor [Gemmataceae bacterium]